ncbi:MAG: HAMP domain-containing protein [Deltaproteobacteria bacterium]|nr:HAMP domain-containing protein [Deltaproteobacteria bacterium]
MRRKIALNVGMILAVLLLAGLSVYRHIASMRTHERAMGYSLSNTENFSKLFFLSTMIQQHQSEQRFGVSTDSTALENYFAEMDALVSRVRTDMKDPGIVASCVDCHAKTGNDNWRVMAPQIESLTSLMASYREQVKEVAEAPDDAHREQKEAMALYLSRTIVAQAREIESEFDKMSAHLVAQYRFWAERTGRNTTAVVILGLLLVSFFVARMLVLLLRPIQVLDRAAREMSAGHYPDPIIIKTKDELETLATTFNRMVESIRSVTEEREELLARTREFNAILEERIAQVRKELEAAQDGLVRSETLSAIGTLASGLAHEINNPIHVIIGVVDLALKDLEPGAAIADDLHLIESEATRCQKIVSGLLDFARHSEPELTLESLNELARQSLDLLAVQMRKSKITCEFQPDPALPESMMDKNKIKQVIVNLLINASQAMTGGGTITISTRTQRRNDVNYIVLDVRDTGSGIPDELQKRIFEPFFTTKKGREGTGLGLAISHRIVEEHRGEIALASKVGEGTTFSVRLPVTAERDVADAIRPAV